MINFKALLSLFKDKESSAILIAVIAVLAIFALNMLFLLPPVYKAYSQPSTPSESTPIDAQTVTHALELLENK